MAQSCGYPGLRWCVSSLSTAFLIVAGGLLLLAASGSEPPLRAAQGKDSGSNAGKALFESTCAACHGLDGRGGERAPNIATKPEVQHLSDANLLQIIGEGWLSKGMPGFAYLGEKKLESVLGYLRKLQGLGQAASLPGNPSAGETLFYGKAACANCHMVAGKGGFLGADLSKYAAGVSVDDIREAITNPNRNLRPRTGVVVVTAKDGHTYEGLARNEDNFSLQLQSADGSFHLFDKKDVRDIEYRPATLMPADYGSKLNGKEIDDLVSYLAATAKAAHEARTAEGAKDEDDN